MKKLTLKMTSAAVAAVMVAACSSSPDPDELARAEREERRQEREERRQQREEWRQERLKEEERQRKAIAEAMPEWALQPPAPDGEGFYAVGIHQASDLNVSLRGAKLRAMYDLASRFEAELIGEERLMEQEGADGSVSTQQSALIESVVDRAWIGGYEVLEQGVEVMFGDYHTFLLVRVPYDEFNQVLQHKRENTASQQMREEFERLEERLERRRQSADEDAAGERPAPAETQ